MNLFLLVSHHRNHLCSVSALFSWIFHWAGPTIYQNVAKSQHFTFSEHLSTLISKIDVHKPKQQMNTSPAFRDATGGLRLSHLTDIWSVSAPIAHFIFCSMWVEKSLRYHSDSHDPRLDHSPPAGDLKYHDLIICADLIPSSHGWLKVFRAHLASKQGWCSTSLRHNEPAPYV